MVALLTVTAGCGSGDQNRSGHTHIDRNNDGYCDEDGEPMPAGGSAYHGSHYYGAPYYGGTTQYGGASAGQPAGPGHAATISGGSAPRGGIGSTHTGGGG